MSPDTTISVPNPVEIRTVEVLAANTFRQLSDEQQERIKEWLTANGVDPRTVAANHPVTLEYKTNADRSQQSAGHIHFTQYYEDSDGHRWASCMWTGGVVVFKRCVPLSVELGKETDA